MIITATMPAGFKDHTITGETPDHLYKLIEQWEQSHQGLEIIVIKILDSTKQWAPNALILYKPDSA